MQNGGQSVRRARAAKSLRGRRRPQGVSSRAQAVSSVAVPRNLGSSRNQEGAGSSVAGPAAWVAHGVTRKA